MENPLAVDMGGRYWNPDIVKERIKEAKQKGHDGLEIKNVKDIVRRGVQDQIAVFDRPSR